MNEPRKRSSISARNVALGSERDSRRHKPDYWILILMALLLTWGLIVVYSISPGLAASQNISQNYFITKQLIAVGVGLLTFFIASSLNLKFWHKAAKPISIVAIIGCIVVMLTPINEIYPAHRWIRAGGFSFQVAELIKFALLLSVSAFIAQAWQNAKVSNNKAVLQPLIILLVIVGIVVAKLQSDLGSTGVVVAMVTAMAFTAGVPIKKIALIGGVIAALLFISISTSDYRRDRFTNFLHPESNCQTSGYQGCQALISVGSGGLLGLGLGYSVQAYGYLPEASNDSIFAIIAEKFGFIGSLLIVTAYGVFITRLKMIIERTKDAFSRLIVVGVMAWLSTQMLINVGAMVGLLPLKGITLPLISQGGTSLIFITAALGIVFQISRYTSYKVIEPDISPNEEQKNSDRSDGRRVGRPYRPTLVTRPRT
jgi:cell division protein FtsW